MSAETRLQELGITLPAMVAPAVAYVPYVQAGKLIFVSGHIAQRDGQPWTGRLGETMTSEDGAQAAKSIAIDLLATLKAAAGDLDRVARIVKLVVLVTATPDFTDSHVVANGASQFITEVFGKGVGSHARSAFGVMQLPRGACVEIEMFAQLH